MTSDTGAVARIVDGLREIVERLEARYRAARAGGHKDEADRLWQRREAALECLAIAEANR